jgi:predicted PurR-regulated permease PerM
VFIGSHDLHRTTKALDDAAFRLSRYFLALTGINASFGVAIAIGLGLIGVPNSILWGIGGAVLRFVPYVGAFIAALALAAAVDPGWTMVIEMALLFVVVEGVVEPRLFGHTTGMSPLAIIVGGSILDIGMGSAGLFLSTPITACLVVLGRHVESLNFIELMLGDRLSRQLRPSINAFWRPTLTRYRSRLKRFSKPCRCSNITKKSLRRRLRSRRST